MERYQSTWNAWSAMRAVIALFITWGLLTTVSSAEEIRDYYAEPGLNPFKETIDQNFHEHIDPFSGTLQLKYTDLIVPGNGGMDIHINRVYTSLQEWELGVRRATGVGWTMHFGRIVVPQAHVDKICNQSIWSVSVRDNPSLELPDGGRELLVLSTEGINTLVTKSNWKAVCGENGIGLVVTSPEGTVYVMDQRETTLDGDSRWYTRLIKDRHANAIQITYKTDSLGALIIDHVTGGSITGGYDEFVSDGRMVQYEYLDEGTSTIRLHRITAHQQALEYHYTRLPNVIGDYYQLTEVVRPDETRWKYDYYPQFTEFGQYGSHSLKTVTYPYGGHIGYSYQGTKFDLDPRDFTITTTVATKTVSGPDSEAGTWSYTYDPGRWGDPDDPAQRRMDLTTVSGPEGTYRYFHYGYTLAPRGTLWQVGLLHIKEVYEGSALLEQVVQDWGTRLIANEDYWHGRDPARRDNETYAPVLLRTVHHRQGTNYITEHSGHDAFGNPHTIVQSSNLEDDPAKVTHLSYYIDPAKWIVHQLEDETVEGIGTIDRTFDENANLLSEVRYGVATTYTYTPHGDIATRTDARGNTVTYSDHHRGIAQREEHPEGVVITRVVNNSGTVASETNGRGYTRRFTYDGLNRLTGITFPIHAPVEINWSSTGKILTRGNLREAVSFDGFGRPIRTERSDTATHTTLTQTLRYDALGRKIFESYPNSTQGVIYTYDVLGRVRRLEHPDGTFKTYDFGTGGNQVTETDERGHSTISIYRAYGAPDNQPVLTWLEAPEDVLSVIERNSIGLVTTLWQGSQQSLLGYQRTYSYDEHLFLVAMEQPETGTTVFGRDAVGNMISRQVGASDSTHYQYDGLNRLIQTDYPGTTPDVTQIYDANGNMTQSITADAMREAIYDENDNLTTETLTIGGHPFTITSTFDPLDAVSALTYPSGRTVTYAPDALGRPTEVLPYITGVTYHPSGQIQQMQYANGQITESELNERLWIHRLHAHGVSEAADLGYHYDPTGNVSTINDAVNPLYNRQLGYDQLNRLVTADGAWGSGAFRYDVRGDIVQKTLGSNVTNYVYNGLRLAKVNQNLYYDYDSYGNIQSEDVLSVSGFSGPSFINLKTYTYDDAGNLRQAVSAWDSASFDYGYDAGGQRVTRTTGGQTTRYVYGRNGNLLGEYTADDLIYGKEYIYLGAQLVANVKENERPIAQAGAAQTADGGQTVTLNGSNSSDPDGEIAQYAWTQTAGQAVSLSNAQTASPSFTAPLLAESATLTFKLTVTDDQGATAAASVTITVRPHNRPPTARAGVDRNVLGGTTVQLDGTPSSDPDGQIVGYQWTQTTGPGVTLLGASTVTAHFTAPTGQDSSLTFTLTVTDNQGATAQALITIAVFDPSSDSDGDGLSNAQEFREGTDPAQPEPAPAAVAGVAVLPGDGDNVVVWNETRSAARYTLYVGTTPGVTPTTGTRIDNVTAPYLHRGLSNGVSYYYLVTASNNTGESAPSAEVNGVPGLRAWATATSFPAGVGVLTVNGRGDRVLVWRVQGTNGWELWAQRYTLSGEWEAPIRLLSDALKLDDLRAALDNKGNALLAWTQYDGQRDNLWSAAWGVMEPLPGLPNLVEQYNGSAYENGWVLQVSDIGLADDGTGVVAFTQQWPYPDPDGSIYISDDLYANLYHPETGWGTPTRLEAANSGYSHKLRLVRNAGGHTFIAWERNSRESRTLFNVWAAHYTPAQGWSPPRELSDPTVFEAKAPAVGVDAAGNGRVVWYQNGSKLEIWERTYDAATASWGVGTALAPLRGGIGSGPEVAVNPRGDAVVVWSSGEQVLSSTKPQGGNWSRVKQISTGQRGAMSALQLGLADDGQARVSWVFADPRFYPRKARAVRKDIFTARYVPATGWGDPVLINQKTGGNVHEDYHYRLDPYGNATVIWNQDQTLGSPEVHTFINHYAVP